MSYPCLIFILAFQIILPANSISQINDGKLLSKNKILKLPVSQSEKSILLDVIIKNDSHRFILDTGAPTFISDSLQSIYNFPIIMEAELQDASAKKGGVTIVRIDTLVAGPFVFAGLPALVLDFKRSPMQCEHFAGNFGSNALRFLIASFDLHGGQVVLTDNKKLLANDYDDYTFNKAYFNAQSDVFFFVSLNNDFPDKVHFDSGDASLYQMTRKKADEFAEKYPEAIVQNGNGVISMGALGLPSATKQRICLPEKISIGAVEFNNGIIQTTESPFSRMGRYLLNYGVLIIDYQKKKISFNKYEKTILPLRFDFGFIAVMDDHRVLAGTVWENGEADQRGLSQGNEIVSINGIKFASLALCDIIDELKKLKESSLEVKLVFVNDQGLEQEVTLHRNIYIK